jgi:hypothetical protein
MADFKKPTLKYTKYILLQRILENSDVLKRLYEIKKDTGLQIGITTSGSSK